MLKFVPLAVITLAVLALQGYGQCPEKYGRYAISGQCDAYMECTDGIGEEKLCPDGLLFNDQVSPLAFPCQYPIDVSCENRGKTQPAQPTEECPHQYGYYRMGDAKNCGQFMNCAAGRGFVFNCPEGLAYNHESYRCDWPDQVPDCDAEAFLGFTCPPEAKSPLLGDEEFRFFKSPHDCQHYYICIGGKPRLYNCGEDNAFNELINACDGIENVTGCAGSSLKTTPQQIQTKPLYGSEAAQCTEKNERYPLEGQCDAYIQCVNGVPEEKLCPDGLLFKEDSLECVYAPPISCGARAKLQPPNGTEECPRQFGFYRIGEDPSYCGQFYNCAHGVAKINTCPEGLAFNKDTYRCDWPDEAADCDPEAFLGFTCPLIDPSEISERQPEAAILRYYPHPKDCKHYVICVHGRPRLYQCAKFLVFNPESKLCDFYNHVPGCKPEHIPEYHEILAHEAIQKEQLEFLKQEAARNLTVEEEIL